MKCLFIPSVLLVFSLASCRTKQEYFTEEQLLKKSDSLTAIRFGELQKQAAEDLDHRIAIEVKPKVDSILEGISGVPRAGEEINPIEIPPMPPAINALIDTSQKDSL